LAISNFELSDIQDHQPVDAVFRMLCQAGTEQGAHASTIVHYYEANSLAHRKMTINERL